MGDMQVWDIKAGNDGYVFFATAAGLTVWDGVRWTSYRSQSDSYLRALHYDAETSTLYSAGNDEFGAWTQNPYGDFEYKLLYSYSGQGGVQVFWRCVRYGNKVYFQSHSALCSWNITTHTIEEQAFDGNVSYLHCSNDSLYLQLDDRLYIVRENGLVPTSINIDSRIVFIRKDNGLTLFFTEDKGIYKWDGKALQTLNNETSGKLSKARIFSAGRYNDSCTLVGSIVDGLFIVNNAGKIIDHISDKNGLNVTTVLSTASDNLENIWLGMDGGIAQICNDSRNIYYHSSQTNIGSVYCMALFADYLFLGTNKGLYRLSATLNLEFIQESQGQVWNFFNTGSELFVCHDKGLHALNNNKLDLLPAPGVWVIRKHLNNTYISADFAGISVYEMQNGKLAWRNKLEGYSGLNNNLYTDKFGHIWLLDSNCPMMVQPSKNLRYIDKIKLFGVAEKGSKLSMSKLDNEVVFYTETSAYVYNIAMDSLMYNSHYSNLIAACSGRPISLIQTGNNFIYVADNQVGLIERVDRQFYKRGNLMDKAADAMIPREYRAFVQLSDNIIALGIQNGAAFHNLSEAATGNNIPLKLRRLEVESQDRTTLLPTDVDHYSISERAPKLKFYLTGLGTYKTVDYRIDNSEWQAVIVDNYLEINELQYGKHTVEIRNAEYNNNLPPYTYQITIQGPWFYYRPYIVAILLVAILTTFFIIQWYIRQRKRKRRHFQIIQSERMKHQRSLHEMEMMRMEMKERDKQLLNFTMENINRNNMLNEIRDEVVALKENLNNNPDQRLRSVVRRIDSHLSNKQNWEIFKKYYNNIHDGFFDRLIRLYSDLTVNELKICAYLKLDLSSKEIATLMSISTTSVEMARHRLRKKLNLPHDKSLVVYMSEI